LLSGLRRKDADDSAIGACVKCGDGTMRIIRMKTGRQFVGCSNYPNCTNTYSLPMGVKITGAGFACPACGAPMIRGFSGGRKIFEICPNPADKQETAKETTPPVPTVQKQYVATPLKPVVAASAPLAVAPEKKIAVKKKGAVKKASKKKGDKK